MWNAHAPELWRRTTIAIRRQLARAAKAAGAGKVQLSYAKVAEFQARGLVHFHAIFRLDATTHDGDLIPRPRRRAAGRRHHVGRVLDVVRHRHPPHPAPGMGHPVGRPAGHPHHHPPGHG